MVNAMYWLMGILVIANIGTICAVIIAALKLSSIFGAIKNQVSVNAGNIRQHDKRILHIERDH